MTPLIPIAAGVGSILLAKASGASNRDALIAGGIGALGAYGAGQLGGVLAQSGSVGAQTATQAFGTALGSTGGALSAGIGAGTLATGMMQPKPTPVDMSGQQFRTGFEGTDPQAYARATENLRGITQTASYAPDPSQQGTVTPSVYDFDNTQMYTA